MADYLSKRNITLNNSEDKKLAQHINTKNFSAPSPERTPTSSQNQAQKISEHRRNSGQPPEGWGAREGVRGVLDGPLSGRNFYFSIYEFGCAGLVLTGCY